MDYVETSQKYRLKTYSLYESSLTFTLCLSEYSETVTIRRQAPGVQRCSFISILVPRSTQSTTCDHLNGNIHVYHVLYNHSII